MKGTVYNIKLYSIKFTVTVYIKQFFLKNFIIKSPNPNLVGNKNFKASQQDMAISNKFLTSLFLAGKTNRRSNIALEHYTKWIYLVF